ncbi:DNA topoisomerase I, partial [bacterium]
GKDGGAFLQIGEGEHKRYADVPEDIAPADLSMDLALELLARKSAPAESIGIHPQTGRRLLLKNKGGYYLEVERTPEEIEAKEKPTWISVPPGVDPRTLPQEELDSLTELPRLVGAHPETGEPILYKMGKFGGYLESGAERRTIEDWREGLSMETPRALEILALPKGRPVRSAPAALKEFGELPGSAGPVKVMSGRFGPYVTDGETNATLPKGTDPANLSVEQATELLARKREAGPSTRKPVRKTAKKPAAKKTTTKKAPAKK